MSLDDKLDVVLKSNAAVQRHYDIDSERDYDKLVPQIKQAFADEGYVKILKGVLETWREYNRMAGYMTGKEWYERFEKELKNGDDYWDVLPAAKRASGLGMEEE